MADKVEMKFYGRRGSIRFLQAFNVKTDGSVNQIPFDRIPTKVGDKFVIVKRIYFRDGPTPTLALPASKILDGVMYTELACGRMKLYLAQRSPPGLSGGNDGATLIHDIDGYRGLNMLAWLTGKQLFPNLPKIETALYTAGNLTAPGQGVYGSQLGSQNRGWLRLHGPFGYGGAAGVNWTPGAHGMEFSLPLVPEHEGAAGGIPAYYLNGDEHGDQGKGSTSGCGAFEFTYGQKAANIAVTGWAGNQVDVYADVELVDQKDVSLPSIFKIERIDAPQSGRILLRQQPTLFLSMQHPLNNGAEIEPGYVRAQVLANDVPTEWDDLKTMSRINAMRNDDRAFDVDFPVSDATLSGYTPTNRSTGFGCVMHNAERFSDALGLNGERLVLNILDKGNESTYEVVQVSVQPRDLTIVQGAARGAGIPIADAVVDHQTDDGQSVDGKRIMQILPAKIRPKN